MAEHEEHKKHSAHEHHEHHEHHEEHHEEHPERRSMGEFVKPGEEVHHHEPVGGPGGEETMPIGTPVRSITPEEQEK